jgi:hypothetical protein
MAGMSFLSFIATGVTLIDIVLWAKHAWYFLASQQQKNCLAGEQPC